MPKSMDVDAPEAGVQVTQAAQFDSHKLDLVRAASSPNFSLDELETRSSKSNSRDFAQVMHVDDEDAFEDALDRSFESQASEWSQKVDLEAAAQKFACGPFLQPPPGQSVQLQAIQTLSTVGLQKQPGPKTKGSSTGAKSRLGTLILDQSWISVYKRLYLITLLLNILGLLLADSHHFPYARSKAVLFSLGNIVMSVLVRNEVFLRFQFWLAVRLLAHSRVPLIFKTMTTALLQSLGGIHSGCGLGAIMWLAYGLVETFRNLQDASNAMVGVAFGILFLLLLSSLAAIPIVRHIHHNIFERVHRFAGWSAVSLVWAYVMLESFWVPSTRSYKISNLSRHELVKMEALWLTVATTIMLILPWLSVRRVAVEAVVTSSKRNTLLHFKGGVKPGLLARVSPSPFSEWHAFGIISDGQQRHTLLASAVGDFTKSLVEKPPTHLWVRTFHFAGLPYLTHLYQRVLQVSTGAGIGVFMSFLLQPTRTDAHLIWIAKSIRESFGDDIWKAVYDAPPERITVIDTAVSGRPNTVELVVKKAIEWKAEVVTVTSNPFGTNEIVNGCKAVGIPAFGPVWDS